MRTKTVKRYWCDFCNKAGLSASAMTKHEKHCTLNPARSCRVCTIINGGYHVGADGMAELVALLPDPQPWLKESAESWQSETHARNKCKCGSCNFPYDMQDPNPECVTEYAKFKRALMPAMIALREKVEDCPACIMAALRQAKIPVPMVDGFDFKAEMQTVFAERAPQYGEDY